MTSSIPLSKIYLELKHFENVTLLLITWRNNQFNIKNLIMNQGGTEQLLSGNSLMKSVNEFHIEVAHG